MLIDRWREIEVLFHAACERPAEGRRAYLESATDDEELRREVESLLANEDHAALFLESNEDEAATDANEARLPAGERIGPYVVVEFMKAGGMGEVYKARDTRLDRTGLFGRAGHENGPYMLREGGFTGRLGSNLLPRIT